MKCLTETQTLLDQAPILNFRSTRLSFRWISVFPYPPPSGRQRPFLWLAPLARFSAFSAAVHWSPFPLTSDMNYLSLLSEGFLDFLLYPLRLTEYQILYSHLCIRTALSNYFYAISHKHFLDFHTSLLNKAPSNSQ